MLINSNLYEEASGSIGSLTARPSAGGISLISKRKTNFTQTPQQQIIRDAISEANYLWQNFTPAIRTGWDDYTKTRPKINASGKIYYYSGLQEFTRVVVLYKSHNAESEGYKTTYPPLNGFIKTHKIKATYDLTYKDILLTTNGFDFIRVFVSITDPNSLTAKTPRGAYNQKKDIHELANINAYAFINIQPNKKYFMKFIFHTNLSQTSKTVIQSIIT